ncbi:MAG: DUF5947 family protein [Terriglobia bacterium]
MNEAACAESDARALARLRQAWSARRNLERCEFCACEIQHAHAHLIEPLARLIVCSCDACALLFEGDTGRFRRIPRDVVRFMDLRIETEWQALSIPTGLAFFFFSTAAGRFIALYPSPAGATEAALALEGWEEIAARHPRLQRMKPDVEALLVNRVSNPAEYYLAPIDRCYELTGSLRKHWRGFTGGDDVWQEVGRFFDRLRQESSIAETTDA